jgi:amino acid adenylation domain-containing protein
LRTDLSGNPTFKELLNRVRDVTLGAYSHQDLPFERLVEELQVERDMSRSPLFQVMFVLQNASNESVELKGLSIEPYSVDIGLSKYDLGLSFKETEAGLQGGISYNTDLFEEDTITRLVKHLEVLLEKVTQVPDQPIGKVSILTNEEETQLLSGWNENKVAYPQELCIHELFEEQVRKTPDEIAVVDEEKVLTYAELNVKANRLAHSLKKEGIQSEVLTGVCLQRSSKILIAILGVLKAGGTYIPIDPKYPAERISYMVEDSQATLLLTEESLVGHLEIDIKLLCINAECQLIGQESDKNLPRYTAPSNLSYVIYTSGSTGKPKGVAIEHRNAVAMISWAKDFYSREELDTVLFGTSICFDLSIYEMFVPLSIGGKVVVAENALAISTLPWRDKITLINTVPSVASELIEMGAIPESVRTINLAGEPLSNELAQKLYSLGTVNKLYNLYGPSEDTTYSTVELVKKGATYEPLIGKPIANTRAYILDQNRNLVPIGVPGELYLQGAGVARGYLSKKKLTEERFIPNLFTSAQENMYKTGDLVRYTEDGKLEYIGRLDDQVKVRGFRIELREIEHMLNSHPKVKETVVVAQKKGVDKRDSQLVAYVVSKQKEEPTRSEMYRYLRKSLPDYMMPSSFVVVDHIPLTLNGKVNRKALLEVRLEMELEEINKNISPRDNLEKIIAKVWTDCLNRPDLSINDNFFESGGHSILAVRVLSQLEANLSFKLSLTDIFKYPTIESLANQIRNKPMQYNWSALVEMKNSYNSEQTPLFLIHGGGTSVLPYKSLVGNLKLDNPIYGINPYGLEQTHSPLETVEDMANKYIKLIQSIQPVGLNYLIGWSLGGLVSLEIAKQLKEGGKQVGLLVLIDSELTNNSDYKETDYVDGLNNLDLPPHLIELTKVHLSAQQKYKITMYNGPTLYIQANDTNEERKDRNKKFLEQMFKNYEVFSVPGDHYSILEEPQVSLISKKIEDIIQAKMPQKNI